MNKDIYVDIKINTTQDFLDIRFLTMVDLQKLIKELMVLMGGIFLEFFSENITPNDIDRIRHFHNIFSEISEINGYKKLLKQMRGEHKWRHFLTAITAKGLLNAGFKAEQIEIEPLPEKKGGKGSDIKISMNNDESFFECKTIYIENFFNRDRLNELANLISIQYENYERLDVYLKSEVTTDKLCILLDNLSLQDKINETQNSETVLIDNEDVEIIINSKKPNIIPDENISYELSFINVENTKNRKLPGMCFVRDNKVICIFGNISKIRFQNKLKSKKEQSIEQNFLNKPFYVVLDVSQVLGFDIDVKGYIEKYWLTEENNHAVNSSVITEELLS
ncbi:MAG: hypothetical protein OEX08_00285 [Candidatus Nomurabacteria bacterium]|nr:hypothetical protein [Candidatus Nomurabacteria bacterium]